MLGFAVKGGPEVLGPILHPKTFKSTFAGLNLYPHLVKVFTLDPVEAQAEVFVHLNQVEQS